MSVEDHKAQAPESVACFILTVSDTRTLDNDTSGQAIAQLLEAAGHTVTGRLVVRDEPKDVMAAVRTSIALGLARVTITTGGTGITSRDSTYEAITALLDKRLDGFGELFRSLSYADIGAAAMLSRACAGTVDRHAIFMLPGSEHAVRLAMTKLIVPELGHIARELGR
jgi:molybdenum cofactor biosynthesis protein B